MKKSEVGKLGIVGLLSVMLVTACSNSEASTSVDYNSLSLDEIVEKAKEEGEVNSVGMPDSWANWKDTWDDLASEYGLKHSDTDMSSAEEIAKFEAEKNNATADIGDVGIAFGPLAKEKELTISFKTSYWNEIPEWAKDDEGHWIVGYTGTIAFVTDKNRVANPPTSWADLANGDYKVTVGDVTTANQAQFAVLAAAFAYGGDESNVDPGIEFFEKLAKDGRINTGDGGLAGLEKGEVDVTILWDFNGLGYRDQIDRERFDVVIPEEASVMSGYATILNKYSKRPHAAMLTREYILSDKGQENLARGYAKPIRENVELPADVQAMLLPNEMYKNARPIQNFDAWSETTAKLPQLWQEKVLLHVN
ncbi:ABC transporter substrate-binding protein [Bacillus alkalicellulosilyticus]|uniref:ABC transporter substrate-binding protein n=1 Tax=Alkalihalobacterium alkalicellulosilyticum TaxID=1912214 RepID=UPI000996FF9A|nr:ABC transporter substrate-binding protein [Bacillus alkalicellulosilyticus]